jgi:hypothetical protein
MQPTCDIALKEWAVTCCALSQGRQLLLLRKGGLLDSDGGVFTLEHSRFWLQRTYLHQDQNLVQPRHRDLFNEAQTQASEDSRSVVTLPQYCEVVRVWNLNEDDEEALLAAPHIWSRAYLDVRFGYKPEHPLLCAALRVWNMPQPHHLPMQPAFAGCRSWLELGQALSTAGAQPALDDEAFAQQLQQLDTVLPSTHL